MAKEEGEETEGIGDATELALINLICERGLSPDEIRRRCPRIREIPFDSERKMMSTIHRVNWTGSWKGMNAGAEGCDRVLLTKGAVDILLERCRKIAEKGTVRPMTSEDRKRILEQNQDCSRKGLRVLALTLRPLRREDGLLPPERLERDYIFLGMAAMMDPPRPETAKAVQDAKRAGIVPVMITGDHAITAQAIAKKAGIEHVIAQVLPDGKAKEIERLQQQGKKVAMVGDGINDAVALTQSDIGIAIGSGSDVAVESADVVLVKDSLQDVLTCIRISKAVIRNIKQNLFWAFFYNSLGIPVAAGLLYCFGGPLLSPVFAGAAMAFSSVSVVTNALRLRKLK